MSSYERILASEISHYQTQRLERTNGIVRQQTGRWHRRQNKLGKVWDQTEGRSSVSGELLQWALDSQSAKNDSSLESRIS